MLHLLADFPLLVHFITIPATLILGIVIGWWMAHHLEEDE